MSSRNKKRNSHRQQGYPENHSLRLFVAIEIPADAVEALLSWQKEYLEEDPALRMTPPGQLHITLAFIGAVGDRELSQAVSQLDDQRRRESFEARLDSLIGLPRGRSPRVIAARVDEPAGILAGIQEELAAGLESRGIFKREKRPYFPHVTVARARGRTRLDLSEIAPEPVQFTAVRLTLYNSILKQSGAVHKALKTVQLT